MLRRLRHTIDAVVARARFERDMRDELRLHVEQRANDLVGTGLSVEDAERQARVEFGAIETYKEQCRDARGFAAMRPFLGLAGDVRLASRRLLATPQFLCFAVLSLAIGISVTCAVYAILYALVWKPLGIVAPQRVVVIAAPGGAGGAAMRTLVSRPDFEDLRVAQRSFSALGASTPFYQTLTTPSASDTLEGEGVTEDYFQVLGVAPFLGRTLQPRDEETAARVVVLNYRVWRSRFDADPGIIGRVVGLGGEPFEVVGVAPASFEGIERMPRRTGGWIPSRAMAAFLTAGTAPIESRARGSLTVVGRLAADRTQAAAAAEITSISKRLDGEFPLRTTAVGNRPVTTLPRGWSARPVDEANASDGRIAAFLLAMVGLVLIVACTNLANLMLARGAARQREFAVRRALGAARWRLVRELMVESALVAALGGVFAVILMRVLLNLSTVDVPLPRGSFSIEPHLHASVLMVASVALLVSLLVFGLEPALQLTRAGVTRDLAGGDTSVGVPRTGRHRAFIRWQVAISATFLLIAAVLGKVVVMQTRHDSGVNLDRLAVAVIPFPREWDEARSRRTVAAAAEWLRHEHAVETVSISSGVPFGMTATPFANITTPDRPFAKRQDRGFAYFLSATPEIFRTLGVRIQRGRGFDQRDDAAAPHVMVISERTARELFGTADAIGRQVLARDWGRPPDLAFTIVGIATDTDSQNLMSRTTGTIYVPLAQHFDPHLAMILARTSGDPAAAARLIQSALRQVDPNLAAGTAGAASILLAGAYFAARVAASLATALGLLTLALAMVGLYGVQAHMVAQRTREVGVRMALGAETSQIERMVLGEGFRPVLQGVVIGLFLGAILRTLLRAYLEANIHPVDPIAFAVVPIAPFIAALLACYLPARRASRVDPNVALRHL